jgi:hypothetical protein
MEIEMLATLPSPINPPAAFEVGAIDDAGLRYWKAVEAMRQGEMALTAQAASLTAMETRAVSIMTWSLTTATAIGLAVVTQKAPVASLVPCAAALGASLCCMAALWPRRWQSLGYSFAAMQAMDYRSELEVRESINLAYDVARADNNGRLRSFARYLRAAWVLFALAPASALGLAIPFLPGLAGL